MPSPYIGPYPTGAAPSNIFSGITEGQPAPQPNQSPFGPVAAAPKRQAQPAKPAAASAFQPRVFPERYDDPMYDQIEQAVGAKLGVPPELLKAIRTKGEKSNNSQVSPKGARTVYQFIPTTRDAFLKKYKVDAWNSPEEGATAAALHLKESYDRTGSWEQAIGEYNGGGDWAKKAESQSYTARVMGALTGEGAQFINPWNPQAYAPALASIGQAQSQAMQPFSATVERPAMPGMPAAPKLPTKDFAAQDKLVEGLAAKPFGEQESKGLQRRRLWQGAAQALAAIPEGAGVGQILGMVGAGMLGGRLSADDEIQARADAYDKEMRQYDMFKLQYEDGKANQKLQEATNQVQLAYDHSLKSWSVQMDQWSKDNVSGIEGNMFVTRSVTKDGKLKINAIPIAALTMPQFSLQRANVQGQMAGTETSIMAQQAGLVNSAFVQAALADASAGGQDGQDSGTGMSTATAVFATQAVKAGIGPNIVSQEVWDTDTEATQQDLISSGFSLGTKEYTDAFEERMTGKLMQHLMTDKNARDNMMQYGDLLSGLRGASIERTVRTKNGPQTVTVKEN